MLRGTLQLPQRTESSHQFLYVYFVYVVVIPFYDMAGKKNFVLRIDQKTHESLEKWAADEFRSVNGHLNGSLPRRCGRR